MNGTLDITNCYEIVYNYGTLEVTKRKITLETPSYEWEYDGDEHKVQDIVISSNAEIECNVLAGELLDGWHIKYNFEHYLHTDSVQPTIVNVGTVDNTVPLRIFKDKYDDITNTASSEDITENFEITYECGKLSVMPRPITFIPKPASKMYDGTPLYATEIEVSEGSKSLAKDTHIFEYTLDGSRTNVYDEDDSFIKEVKITSAGEDITYNYDITLEEGNLEILPRPLHIVTGSATYEFDATEKNCLEYTVNEELSMLLAGHEITVTEGTTAMFAGTVNNSLSFAVADNDGRMLQETMKYLFLWVQ
jgi:hypothetical protein